MPTPAWERLRLPTLFTLRSPARIAVTLVLCWGVFWLVGTMPAQAVPNAATASTGAPVFTPSPGERTQVDALTSQAQAVQAQIDALNAQLKQESDQYDVCLVNLDSANARMSQLRRTIADAQAEKALQQALLAERLKSVYMAGGPDQLLQMLLLANGVEDLYNRVRLITILANQDNRLVSDLETSTTRVDLLVSATDEQKREALDLRNQLAQRTADAQATLTEKQNLLGGLDLQVKALLQRIADERAAAAAAAAAAALQREQAAAASAAAASALVSSTPLSTSYTPESWAQALLEQCQLPVTPTNLRAIVAWEMAEGGNWNNSAHYNPLNTTMPETGATAMNSVGVKAYTSWSQGFSATIATLYNGNYTNVIVALKAGNNAQAVAAAVAASPWGTGLFSVS